MKFGKFELSNYFIGAVALVVILYIVLHFTYEEEKLKERTKQLQLEQNITQMKEGEASE